MGMNASTTTGPKTAASPPIPVAESLVVGATYVSRDEDCSVEVQIDSFDGARVYYSGDADGSATLAAFLMDYAPLSIDTMTSSQLADRADLLESAIEANENANRVHQAELERIFARIDALNT